MGRLVTVRRKICLFGRLDRGFGQEFRSMPPFFAAALQLAPGAKDKFVHRLERAQRFGLLDHHKLGCEQQSVLVNQPSL
jgi:hypothetical protein